MALSCLAGTNPLPVAARTSCTVGGSASSGRKQETDPMMLESPPPQQPQRDDLNSSANASMISSGAPSPSVDGVRSASSLSAPSPNGASGGIPLNLFQQQQQQQQQQQAAMAAAFRAASLANYPGVVGQLPPHLPSLMASLQAVAGVPFHPHSRASAGLAGLLPNLPFNFPSMAQHQSALLNWSKLAQSAAAAALGVDGLGSILQQQQHQHQHQHQHHQAPQQHQQLSPDSSSHARKPNNMNNNKNVNYTGGLIVSGVADKVIKSAKTKTVKSAVARRNAKNALSRLGDLLDTDSVMKQELIIAEPPMVSPVGTTTSSSPPSVTGSSGGSSGGKRSTNAGEGSRDKVFSCSICHRTFGYKHVLQNHERTHTGEKPFECKQCGKRFTRDHHLKTHMRLHTGEKPYNCTHCDRQFVQVANLRRHLRVHTGERPYACELCTSRFSDSNQLKAHMLIHKGEKPFQCQLCSGRFRRRHHLMHHKCPKDPGAVLGKMTKIIGLNNKDAIEEAELTESEPPPTPSSYASPPEDEEMDDEDLALIKQQREREQQQQQQMILKSQQQQQQRGSRKPRETRRVIRPADLTGSTDLSLTMNAALASQPEQTEPEDLSTSSRMRHPSAFSVGSTGGWSAAGSVSIDLNSDRDDDDDVDDEVDDELMLADEELDEDDDDADLSDTVDMIRKKRRQHALDLVSARKAKV